jgi:hypothetical protein
VALVGICEKAMRKRPEDRYQSAAEFGAALEQWIALSDFSKDSITTKRTMTLSGRATRGKSGDSSEREPDQGRPASRPVKPQSAPLVLIGDDDTTPEGPRPASESASDTEAVSVAPAEPDDWAALATLEDGSVGAEEVSPSHIFGDSSDFLKEQQKSIAEARRTRRQTALKSPWWLWIVLAAAVVLALWLTAVVVRSNPNVWRLTRRAPCQTTTLQIEPGYARFFAGHWPVAESSLTGPSRATRTGHYK